MSESVSQSDCSHFTKLKSTLYNPYHRRLIACDESSEVIGLPLRIMQWNIFAQGFVSLNEFVYCDIADLNLTRRLQYITDEIVSFSPDIVCVQEADIIKHIFIGLKNHFNGMEIYDYIFLPKKNSACLAYGNNYGPDGVGIFFKINKYKLIHQAVAPLDDSGHRESLIATFQTIGSDSPVIFHIACVHLKSKTHFANLRINQGRRLLDFFEKYLHSFNKSHIERKNEVDPVFIVGDFNAETYEEVINIVSSWSPHCYGTGQKLVSAYKRTNGGKEPEFTTWKIRKGPRSGDYNEAKHTIDYIWYLSPRAKLKGVFSIPSSETIGHQALPSSSFPSDHMSLIADFII